MNDIEAVLFDKDGTLVDFDRTWGPAAGAVMAVLADGDAARLAALQAVSEYQPDERRFLPSSPLVAGSSADYGPLWARVLDVPPAAAFLARIDDLFAREGLRFLTPIGDPARTLARLAGSGLALHMVTNDAELNARQQIAALGLTPWLDQVYGYDSGYGAKPGPGMVLACAARGGHAPERVAVVGDTAHDLDAARAAGARFILVRSGPAPVAHLAAAADLVIDSVDDLPEVLAAAASRAR
ncbi:HAD family hydrolase [Xanthobacter sp. V4C-4]|uniref:HAD family hydrolase n=1 Tax=Xanthobacter cornucopiae TaxID=3119924 RepID=UPI003729902E